MGDKVLELMKEDDAAEVARRVAEQNGKSDVPGYKDGFVEGWFRGMEKQGSGLSGSWFLRN